MLPNQTAFFWSVSTMAVAFALHAQRKFYGSLRTQTMLASMGRSCPKLPERIFAGFWAYASMLLALIWMIRWLAWWTVLAIPLSFLVALFLAGLFGTLGGVRPRLGFWTALGLIIIVEGIAADQLLTLP